MSRFMPSRLELHVSYTAITLCTVAERNQSQRRLVSVALEPGEPMHALQSALSSLSEEDVPRGARLSIVLADPVVRLFLVTPPANATTLDDLRGATLLRFEHLYGLPLSNWSIAAAWHARHAFLAWAIPTRALEILAQFATTRQVYLERLTSLALDGWSHALQSPSDSWLLSRDGAHVMLVARTNDGLCAIRSLRWPDETWASWDRLEAELVRESIRLDCAPPRQLCGAGDIPPELHAAPGSNMSFQSPGRSPLRAWLRASPPIDLRHGDRIRARLSIAVSVAALSAVLLTGIAAAKSLSLIGDASSLQAKADEITQRRAVRERQLQAAPATSIKREQIIAVNGAINQLNLPWRQLLRDIEEVTPREIALLAIEPDARIASLKGTAEASTADDMLAYVAALREQGGFRSVLLTRHELNEQDPMRPYRFQFEALWRKVDK